MSGEASRTDDQIEEVSWATSLRFWIAKEQPGLFAFAGQPSERLADQLDDVVDNVPGGAIHESVLHVNDRE